jgi:hypothetical protein
MLSSVTLTEMVSHYRRVRGIDPDALGLHKPSKEFQGKTLIHKFPSKKDS